MKVLESLVKGFLAMSAIILVYCIVSLVRVGESWLGFLYFLILVIPLSHFGILWRKKKINNSEESYSIEKLEKILFLLQGTALAGWAFDISTTYYAINVTHLATEMNPLGWPFGIVGALVFYVPTLAFSYFLISKHKDRLSLCVGSAISLLVVYMGFMNLGAGAQNLEVFLNTVSLPARLKFPLFTLIILADGAFLASQLIHFQGRQLMPSKTIEVFKKHRGKTILELKIRFDLHSFWFNLCSVCLDKILTATRTRALK
jgi:hypothetical protein